ncbi:flavin-containing monooxygenase [Sciscionella marina]|uniref:flavin-containing monooxygenase n=1 Tax=Sciscionella marina TaxID=508770 RepID=UPI000475F074|nr:NAD(P)/FAD-dependent oxidoreductase [Sciscionella marina]
MSDMVSADSGNTRAQGSEDRLRAALDEANIPTLVMVLAHLTGEDKWLSEPYCPKRGKPLDDNDSGELPENIQQEIRDAVLKAVTAYRQGAVSPAQLAPERVAEMLETAIVEEVPSEYGPLLSEELGLVGRDVDMPKTTPGTGFRVLVIGAGISGLCTAIKLQQAGIDYLVVEKNASVGGTWLENTYPGCGVDTPSHLYCFSFAQNPRWPRYFAKRDHVYEYLERLADEYTVRDNIRFNTEVVSAEYDEGNQSWRILTRDTDGTEELIEPSALVTAVGMVNRPFIPDLPGLSDFSGPAMHTAQWRDDVDVTGKRVAVIGNGASAMQLVPSIAEAAESVTVFQRSNHWAIPHPNYHREVPENVRLVMEEVPFYAAWYRLRLLWNFSDRLHPQLQIDPEWPHPERSINAANESHRRFLTGYIESELAGRTDLIEACTPNYPPYGKRPLIDNGWYRTLRREDVRLVTEAVSEVRAGSVIAESGEEFDADVVVFATGFKTLQFLWPMQIRGRSGRALREMWGEDDARAYLGITVPDFPNLFIINGPNTNAGHGGSAVISTEFQVRYVMDLLSRMFEHGVSSAEVRSDVFWDYNKELDDALSRSIWVHPGMRTYYRNDAGRVVVSSPWKYIDYWERTRHADLGDYILEH